MSLSVEILQAADGIAVAEVGSVCVVIWRGEVNDRSFQHQRAGLAKVVERHPGKAGFLCVVEPKSPAPKSEFRRASVEMITSHHPRLVCTASVVEGNGLIPVIARSVLTGMMMLSRPEHMPPNQIFANVGDAGSWLAKHMPAASLSSLTEAVEKIRASLG